MCRLLHAGSVALLGAGGPVPGHELSAHKLLEAGMADMALSPDRSLAGALWRLHVTPYTHLANGLPGAAPGVSSRAEPQLD